MEPTKTNNCSLKVCCPCELRNGSPFLFDLCSRVVEGAVLVFVIGFVFFKRPGSRKFCTLYGAGFGLGMNYIQAQYLY